MLQRLTNSASEVRATTSHPAAQKLRRLMLATSALMPVLGAVTGFGTPASAAPDPILNLYWNGTTTNPGDVLGGAGTWYSSTPSVQNWTDSGATTSYAWVNGSATYFSGTGGAVEISGSSVTVAGMNFLVSGYTISSASGSGGINLGGSGQTTISVASNVTTTISSVLADTGNGLIKTGTGTLTLTGDNTYTGATTISAGTLIAGSNNALGTSAGGTTVISGAMLQLASGVSIADAVTIAGSGISSSGALSISSGSATISGNVTLAAAATVTVQDAASLTLSGTLAGTFSLSRSFGNGELVLAGNNSAAFTNLNIQNGTLTIANQSNLTGGTLTLNMGNTGVGGLKVTDSDVTISKNITFGASGGRIIANNTLTLSGNITGGVSSNMSRVISFTKTGTGKLILTGTNNYTSSTSALGGTMVEAGILSITNGTNIGTGAVILNGGGLEVTGTNVIIDRNILLNSTNATLSATNTAVFAGVVSGSRMLTTGGGGKVILTGANTYSGGTTIGTGTLQVSDNTALGAAGGALTFAGGTLSTTEDMATSRNVTVGANGGGFDTAQTKFLSLGGTLSGTGALAKTGEGELLIAGNGSGFGGTTTVSEGTLRIGPTGSLGGGLVVASGATLASNGGGSFSGTSIVLQSGSITEVTLGAPNATALFTANNLTVAGTLNVYADTGYGTGIYRIFASTNALTNNGLVLGSLPSTGGTPQLVIGPNTVNLAFVDSSVLFWSPGGGTSQGGAGTWDASATNWLNGDNVRLSWGGQMAVFGGDAGTVTVNGTQQFTTLEFITSGYAVNSGTGGKLDFGTGGTVWAEGADVTATIATEITGTGALTKVGAGTIILSGENSYQGGTIINAGTLQIASVGALGSGNVSFGGGTLAITQDLTTSRTFTFGTDGGTLNIASGTTTELGGSVDGAGAFTKTGAGTVIVSGFFSGFTGALTVDQGTLALSGVGVPVNASSVTVNGTLDISAITASVVQLRTLSGGQDGQIVLGAKSIKLNQGTDAIFAGVISGSGGLEFGGAGVLTLTGASTYTGETTVSVGTLVAGSSGALGSSAGGTTVSSGAALQLASGVSIGDALTLAGSGVSNGGALVVNAGSATVSGNVNFTASASVTVADSASLTLSGTLAGPYSLTRSTGNGELILTGDNSLSLTDLNIQVGTLTVASQNNLTAGTLRLNMGNTGVGGLKVTGSNVVIDKNIVLGASGGRVINDNTLTLSGNITGGISSNQSSQISFTKAGSGKLILSGTNTYTSSTGALGGTQVLGGTLSIASQTNLGSGAIILNGGNLEVTGGDTSVDRAILLRANASLLATGFTSFDGAITESSSRALTTGGGGTIALTGVNTYSGGTTIGAGRVTITADTALGAAAGGITFAGGTLYTMSSITSDRNVTVGANGGTFRTDGGTVLTLTGTLSGTGALTKSDGGTLKLTGNNSGFGGTITVAEGGLEIGSGATLGGSLVVGADATLTGGGGSTNLTSLVLQDGATTSVTLRSVNPNAVFSADDLTVAGTLNLTAGPGYGVGVYRIFASTNALTDNGLTLGNVPTGSLSPQLQIGTNSVNVLVADASLQFWSPGGGTTQGGSGLWTSSSSNWLNADDVRMGWGGQMAVFGGEAGTVTVFGTQSFSTLEFTTSGYVVESGVNGKLDLGTGGTVWAEGADITATISTEITGSGALTKTGAGTIILSGENSYQGDTLINAGTLQIAADAALGTGGTITLNGGTLAVTQDMTTARALFVDAGGGTVSTATGTTTTVTNNMYGTGNFTKAGAGTLALSGGLSTFTGGLVVQQGTLALSGDAIPANASSVTVNAKLDISGITAGTTLVHNLSGSADGRIELGSKTIEVSKSGTTTFAGVISGTGSLRTSGIGTLILTGNNTYTGGTRVEGGTLQIGDGGTTGSIIGTTIVDSGATLVFNRSDAYTFDGTISGDGTVSFKGGGTVLFSNPSSYTGTIAVDDSRLVLENGSSSGATYEVNSGGAIGGNGTIGGLVVNDGGVASPGNSPGSITVNGTVTFNSGSVYRVDVTPSGQHDLITATGAVTINSGSSVEVVAVPGIYAVNSSYAILTGASVTGAFGSVTSDYAFLTPTLSYDAQNVFLTLVYDNPNIRFASYAQTSNQLATADAVQALGLGAAMFDAVVQLPGASVAQAFNALSGEAYASTSSLMQQQSVYVREAVGARLRQSVSAPGAQPLAYAAQAAGPSTATLGGGLTPTLWAQGYGGWGETYGNGNAATLSNSIGGFLIGADVAVMPNARLGLFGGFSQSQFDVTDRSSTGSMDNYDVGVYGAAQFGALALRGGLTYTWHDVSMDRSVLFPGVSQSLNAGYTVGTTQVFGELGYDIPVGAYAFEPFVGLAYVATNGASLNEGGGSAALGVDIGSFDTLYTTLGLRAATSFQVMGRTLTPNMTLGWQHAFGDTTPTATMLFQGGATPFQVSGVPIAEDALLLGAGLSYALSDVAALAVNYTGQLATNASQNAFTAQFSLKF